MAFAACTLARIAELTEGELSGDPEVCVTGVAGLDEAGEGDISFLANPKYADRLRSTRATAVLVGRDIKDVPCAAIRVDNPDLAFARTVNFMAPDPHTLPRGVHPTAVVADDADVGADVAVGAHVVIETGARIGAGVELWPGAYVGHEVEIGAGTVLMPGVVVYQRCIIGADVVLHAGVVVGSDGFGYTWDGARHVKVPQVGIVRIEDEVEIGANTVIDRARFGETVIGKGSKLDNLIQIAHNVKIGPCCAFAAQVGVSGSSSVGAGTLLGGQVGVAGHLMVGSGAQVSGQAGITKDLPGGAHYTGYPARPHEQQLDEWRHLKALPRLRRQVREMQRRLEQLEAQTDNAG